MTTTSRRGEPTPPISLDAPASAVRSRFGSRAVPVSAELVDRLRSVCARVATDDETCVEAGRDWWPLTMVWALEGEIPARPAAVARPSTPAEVAAVVACCNEARVPMTPAAGRSGVCGASVPVFGGVVLDLTGLSGITGVDDASLVVGVQPGTFGDVFEDALRAEHGLTVGHWPQSMGLSTVGGWLACRGAGQYSTRYGKIEDMVIGLEVVLADGRTIRTGGRAPRSATGPDLTQLFVGSEGTLGVITHAELRAHPVPASDRRAAYGFTSFAGGLEACRRVLRRGATPAVLRLYDQTEAARNFSIQDRCLLIVLDEGDPALIDAVMAVVAEECHAITGAEDLDPEVVDRWLTHRNDVSALESTIRRGIVVDTIEIAARWAALPAMYEEAVGALQKIDGTLAASAHQSHAYTDGACLYFTFAGLPGEDADRYYRDAWDAVMAVTEQHGAAVSHHHGIGLNRGRVLPGTYGPAFGVLAGLKAQLDPNGILNPGKLGLPSPFGEAPWP